MNNIDTIYILNQPQGEYFLGISLDIIAAIFIPLFIFGIGYFINYFLELKKENKRLRILEEYYYFQIEMLLKDVDKDIKGLEDFLSLVEEDKQQNYTSQSSSDTHVNNLLGIIHTDLYKIFIRGRKGNLKTKIVAFDKLDTGVKYIKSAHSSFPDHFKYFMKQINEYYSKWNESVENIRKIYEEYSTFNVANRISLTVDTFLRKFDRLLYDSLRIENGRDMYKAIDNLIRPLQSLCNEFREDPRILQLSNCVVECESSFDNVVNLKSLFKDLFNVYLKKYKSSKENLLSEVKVFKGMKEKLII